MHVFGRWEEAGVVKQTGSLNPEGRVSAADEQAGTDETGEEMTKKSETR